MNARASISTTATLRQAVPLRPSRKGWLWLVGALALLSLLTYAALSSSDQPTSAVIHAGDPIRIGSKGFTESIVLAEALERIARERGFATDYSLREAGSGVAFRRLLSGDLDIYPEYTGTLIGELLARENLSTRDELRESLEAKGISMSEPLGFANNYAIAVRRDVAEAHSLSTISDLLQHPEFRVAVSNEFLDRADGWRALANEYGLPQSNVRGVQHELAYSMIVGGQIEVMDAYSTDAYLQRFDLVALRDDRGFFPTYDAVMLYRTKLSERAGEFVEAVRAMAGQIDESAMIGFNAVVDVERESEHRAAADLVASLTLPRGQHAVEVAERGKLQVVVTATGEHLLLVLISLSFAVVVSIPLGVFAAKAPALAGQGVLGGVGVLQTIPALALLALMVPILAGYPAEMQAIVALFLYSLLPIVRNTYAGLQDIAPELTESATVLGLSPLARLFKVELPMASRHILAGIKTSAVINVGTATLGALIGAGGYGDIIMAGIRLIDTELVLHGLIPAALMALALQFLLDLSERGLVSPGLRNA